MTAADNDEGGMGVFVRQIPTVLSQRRWVVLGVWLLGIVLAGIALVVIPTEYRAKAVMVVQPPQVPQEMVGNAIGDNVERRLETIRQQIISRPDLIAIINRNGLYGQERATKPLSKVIDHMRKRIALAPIDAPSSSQPINPQEVAFELTFDYPEPDAARDVAQQLMERIVNFYSARNAAQASNAVDYLGSQQATLQRQIGEVEQQINVVSSQNGRALANMSAPIINTGSNGAESTILELQRENATLLQRKAGGAGSAEGRGMVAIAEDQLAAARTMYSENHPDVVLARQRLAEAKRLARDSAQTSTGASIDQQIALNNSQIAALRAQGAQERAQTAMVLSAQSRGPAAQQEISALQQKLTGLNQQYQAISAKYIAAQANARANDEQLGRQLTVIEPPTIPDQPKSPNRLVIIAAGLVGGLILGLIAALALELLAHPIRHPDTIARITGHPPLGVIPDVGRSRRGRRASHGGAGRRDRRFWRFAWPMRRSAQATTE